MASSPHKLSMCDHAHKDMSLNYHLNRMQFDPSSPSSVGSLAGLARCVGEEFRNELILSVHDMSTSLSKFRWPKIPLPSEILFRDLLRS